MMRDRRWVIINNKLRRAIAVEDEATALQYLYIEARSQRPDVLDDFKSWDDIFSAYKLRQTSNDITMGSMPGLDHQIVVRDNVDLYAVIEGGVGVWTDEAGAGYPWFITKQPDGEVVLYQTTDVPTGMFVNGGSLH